MNHNGIEWASRIIGALERQNDLSFYQLAAMFWFFVDNIDDKDRFIDMVQLPVIDDPVYERGGWG